MESTALSPASQDPAALPMEELENRITALAANINAATCRWLLLLAEFDRREGKARMSHRTPGDYFQLTPHNPSAVDLGQRVVKPIVRNEMVAWLSRPPDRVGGKL